MNYCIAFDVYGTLIDTAGVVESLRVHVPQEAEAFSSRWREKQLEYSFRRGLMGDYRDFSVCTRDALAFTCRQFGLSLTDEESDALMSGYRRLPAFPDAQSALESLSQTSHRLFAFSNGLPSDLDLLLKQAGIGAWLQDVISVHEIRRFKPDPEVYHLFNRRTRSQPGQCWLVSGNPFDILGAARCGFKTAWVRRRPETPFDPWGVEPTAVIDNLAQLPDLLGQS